jgi:hypothetical protein
MICPDDPDRDYPPGHPRDSVRPRVAIAFAALVFLGVIVWALSGHNRQAASDTRSPPTTTIGQSTKTPPSDSAHQANPKAQ